jgi:ABC-type nickel/cobalt efflux system permease component RcnA
MTTEAPPIACTLAPRALNDRLAWIGALARDALRGHERRDLALHLRYSPEAAGRVREMIRNEQACCSFLAFDLHEAPDEIRLTITAPETARAAADMLFEQFIASASCQSECACAPATAEVASRSVDKQPGAKTAGLIAATLATGAVACAACCVLPFALPAAVLAGGMLAWLAKAHLWIAGLAILVVIGAWIAWRKRRTRCKPAPAHA